MINTTMLPRGCRELQAPVRHRALQPADWRGSCGYGVAPERAALIKIPLTWTYFPRWLQPESFQPVLRTVVTLTVQQPDTWESPLTTKPLASRTRCLLRSRPLPCCPICGGQPRDGKSRYWTRSGQVRVRNGVNIKPHCAGKRPLNSSHIPNCPLRTSSVVLLKLSVCHQRHR